MNEIVLANNQT